MKIKTKRRNFYALLGDLYTGIESRGTEGQECKLNSISSRINNVIYNHNMLIGSIKNYMHKSEKKFNRDIVNY